MSSIKVQGVVLRYANFGEQDRMLTLLTPNGLLSVAAKGCRKTTSKTLAASELFTAGEYVLHQKGERYTLSSFQLQESYYPIRLDFDKLSHGTYWVNLCEAVTQPNEDSSRLLKMLLLSLAVLAYADLPTKALTAVFLAQFAMLQGFAPRLDRCLVSGQAPSGRLFFDAQLGGICCGDYAPNGAKALTHEALLWMREAQEKGAFVLAGRRALPEAAAPGTVDEAFGHFRAQVENRLERKITSGKFL